MDQDVHLLIIGPQESGKTFLANLLLGKEQDGELIEQDLWTKDQIKQQPGSLYGQNKLYLRILEVSFQDIMKIDKAIQDQFKGYINKILVCLDSNRKFDETAQRFIKIAENLSPSKQKISIIMTKCNILQKRNQYNILRSWNEALSKFGFEKVYFFYDRLDRVDKRFQISLQNSEKEKIIFDQIYSEKQLFNQQKNDKCFSLDMEISLINGKSLAFNQDIDHILNYDSQKNEFLGYIHLDLHAKAEFIQFRAEFNKILECTSNHLIFCFSKEDGKRVNDYVEAQSIEVGDFLLVCQIDSQNNISNKPIKVKEKNLITKRGFWCPLTTTGSLVMNQFVSSSYVRVSDLISQKLSHLYMKPLIMYRSVFGYQKYNNQISILSPYASAGEQILKFLTRS